MIHGYKVEYWDWCSNVSDGTGCFIYVYIDICIPKGSVINLVQKYSNNERQVRELYSRS